MITNQLISGFKRLEEALVISDNTYSLWQLIEGLDIVADGKIKSADFFHIFPKAMGLLGELNAINLPVYFIDDAREQYKDVEAKSKSMVKKAALDIEALTYLDGKRIVTFGRLEYIETNRISDILISRVTLDVGKDLAKKAWTFFTGETYELSSGAGGYHELLDPEHRIGYSAIDYISSGRREFQFKFENSLHAARGMQRLLNDEGYSRALNRYASQEHARK